ncbi:hypothetical protein AAFF_G00301740 [Aldrovandia affinis]|uniref:Uncharacterized protein n=1 Tax=Aldrovandia affinis TaxID=143900 RepID=A0AAD7SQ67_9TELE|nr:hypothetical protein AAFF_G00301740 [Aldrovandia affinis]
MPGSTTDSSHPATAGHHQPTKKPQHKEGELPHQPQRPHPTLPLQVGPKQTPQSSYQAGISVLGPELARKTTLLTRHVLRQPQHAAVRLTTTAKDQPAIARLTSPAGE